MAEKEQRCAPREMLREDLPAVVELHRHCFPDYFLTGLGPGVLYQFYAAAVEDPRTIAAVLVEESKGDIVGLVVGTLNAAFHTNLMRSNLDRFALGLVRGLFLSRTVRQGLKDRLNFFSRLFRPKMDDTLERAGVPPTDMPEARLLDVATHEDWRGGRNAERLVDFFTDRMFTVGSGRVGATVRPGNIGSLILYKRLGWNTLRTAPDRIDVWLDRPA